MQELANTSKIELSELLSEAERRQAKKDCAIFISSFLKTFDPRPDVIPHDVDFVLYEFQDKSVKNIVDKVFNGGDLLIEKSRDMGVSWISLAVLLWCWLFVDGFQALVGSRKEDYVDNGQIDSLFGKLDYMIRNIKDRELLPPGFDVAKHRTYMKLVNPNNGNTILGESSNKNFSRAGRYTVVFFDELGFWPDARRSWQAAGDATRFRLAVTTPPDEPSFAKSLRFSDKIEVLTLHWKLHPRKDDAWYEYEKSRRNEEEVLHELDISWEYSSVGKPYPEVKFVDINRYEYDSSLPVYISLDIGLDAVAIGWYQPVRNSNYITLIDSYENYDKIIDWYAPFFGQPISSEYKYTTDDIELINRVKMWGGAIFFGDPSGKSRHVESAVSPYEILRAKYGIVVQTNDTENNWTARRDATKRVLSHFRVNDTPRNRWFIDCLSSARYPKRDAETSQSTNPISKPVHDWTSHHRTQLEYFAVNYHSKPDGDVNSYVSQPYQTKHDTPFAINGIGLNSGIDAILNRDNNNSQDWML